MKITLYLRDKIKEFTLPAQISGSFSFAENEDDNFKLINIEAREDKWYLYTTDDVNVLEDNNIVDGLFLEINNFYVLHHNNVKYLIYVSNIFDETFKVYKYNIKLNLVIGRSDNCNVIYNCPYLNKMIAYIKIVNGKIALMKSASTLIYVNNKSVKTQNMYLAFGDMVEFYGLKIYILSNYIMINNPASHVILIKNTTNLEDAYFKDEKIINPKIIENDLYKDEDYFSKAPRIQRSIDKVEVKLDNPPKREEDKEMPFILIIGPMLTMGIISFVMIINTINKLILKQTTLAQSWTSLLIGVVMIISILVWPMLTKSYNKKQKDKKDLKIIIKYDQYLEEKKNELLTIANNQRNIINEQLIDLYECLNIIYNRKINFWTKRIDQSDFLNVRIGIGDSPLEVDIAFPEQGFSVDENVLKERAQYLVDSYKYLKMVPIGYSFYDNKVTAIMGNVFQCHKFVDNILLQLITFYSYDDLKIALFTDENNKADWQYLKYLNHNFNNAKNLRFFASNIESSKKLCEFFNFEVSQRINQLGEDNIPLFKPYYLIILDGYENAKHYDFIKTITELEINIGFSVIIIENKMNSLPSKCNNFILLTENKSGVLKNSFEKQEQTNFFDEIVYNINMMDVAKIVANIPIETDNEEYQLPDAISFLEMENVGKVEQLNILNRWNSNDSTLSLKAEVGVDSNGELIYLDLHEKAHGPHGLIAGMTGSGKSEFIITYILSMCINYSPEDVAFILIDYKGGGLAYAFENKATGVILPHLAGIITNLDKAQMNRTLVSIDSEIKKRQKIFNEVRDKFEENTMDIYKYQRLFKDGRVNLPIPHLFIICDEFAELKSQQPDFMDDLISVARIGRSLGVHLILATQKPSGVVNDQIWSNTKFRVCLKVQNGSDSQEMLKKPDAAALKQTGRFYLQVGYDEIYELGQSAWCGANYTPTDRVIKQVDHSINFIDDCGTFIKNIKEGSAKKTETKHEQISVILESIINFAQKENKIAKRLWLDDLNSLILTDDLIKKYNYQKEEYNVEAIIGEYDAPQKQEQGLLTLNFKDTGNLAILGNDSEEVELLIKNIIYSTSILYSPDEINTYIVDFGSESLNIFAKFPQVGGVVYSIEKDKYNSLFRLLRQEIESRRKLFASFEGNYYKYISSNNKLPIILVIINNLDLIVESYKNVIENLVSLTRASDRYGVNFVVSCSSRPLLGRKLLQNFGKIYAMHISDTSDYSVIFNTRSKIIPAQVLGRGLTTINDQILEFQTASIIKSSDDLSSYIKNVASTISFEKEAKRIPILPEVVNLDYISLKDVTLKNVPIGMSKQTLEIVDYDFITNKFSIVTATKLDKISNFIQSLINLLEQIKINVIVIDPNKLIPNSTQYYYDNNFKKLFEELNKFIKTENNNTLIVFYGITSLKLNLDNMDSVEELLLNIKKSTFVSSIICDSEKNFKIVEYEKWYGSIKNSRDGIWVGSGFLDQNLLKYIRTKIELINDNDNDFGYVIKDSEVQNIKLVDLLHSGGEEDEK